ncbi:malonyl-CoA decarboxylase domain-containing protein [Shimia ponticola]|uniref:malonyl-CoA decarboxylase domain-containing protein n=1 Tax=Shimia ponticola TaxID=2582893 RepID=UPI0011BF70D0|nr:malonyl-CoA decarboxylase family protein [Shimia ponticola]
MAERSFLGDMLTTLFERRQADQAASDERSLPDLCRALLDAEGEVSGIRLAQTILDRYGTLDDAGRRDFFTFLNDDLEINVNALGAAAARYAETNDLKDYQAMVAQTETRRWELFRRLNMPMGATRALVEMRRHLLVALKDQPDLKRTDIDFRHLLRSWFNRGFLVLRQISWETPASILEKIVEYEAVHAIESWDDLRRRLYPQDRRCFAYFHPAMPEEPLIFVEVALTQAVPDSIQGVLAEDRAPVEARETTTAVFYSISNCQQGLTGISFGNFLIKQVVEELKAELPGLTTFVTLSPIPRLNAWLRTQPEDDTTARVLANVATEDEVRDTAAAYLRHAKTSKGLPFDPVARFHLGNGAQIYAVHGNGDTSPNGIQQSSGAMVNYHYDLTKIEANHERFQQSGEVALDDAFQQSQSPAKTRIIPGRQRIAS